MGICAICYHFCVSGKSRLETKSRWLDSNIKQLHPKLYNEQQHHRTLIPSSFNSFKVSSNINRSRKSFGLDQMAPPTNASQSSLQDLIPLVNSSPPKLACRY